MRVNDALSGVVLVVLALAMIAYTRTFPAMPGQDYGPALFPTLIGLGLILAGLTLIGQGWAARARAPWIDAAVAFGSRRQLGRLLAVPASLILYMLLADPLGFILTAWLLLFGLLLLFRGGQALSSTLIALVVTLIVHYAFTQWLLVPLPPGLLQSILY